MKIYKKHVQQLQFFKPIYKDIYTSNKTFENVSYREKNNILFNIFLTQHSIKSNVIHHWLEFSMLQGVHI